MGSKLVHLKNSAKYLQCRKLRVEGVSCGIITQSLGISDSTFYRWTKDIETKGIIHPRYRTAEINHDYFSQENIQKHPERMVIVGFIAADGCISMRFNTPQLVFNISAKDRCCLETINAELCSSSRKIGNITKTKSITLSIPSHYLANDLSRFGIVPRKTAVIELPPIQGDFMRYFIRGYFYGDGCVYKPQKQSARMYHFVGNARFISQLKSHLLNSHIVERCGVYAIKNSEYMQMHIKGSQSTLFGEYLFHDELCMLIPRKHIKI